MSLVDPRLAADLQGPIPRDPHAPSKKQQIAMWACDRLVQMACNEASSYNPGTAQDLWHDIEFLTGKFDRVT